MLDRGYGELLQPLHYCQVAPTLFLWGQLTVVKLLGFNEYALRLIPFLCGLGSLLLFRHVAGRLLQGAALVLAVGLFAVAYPMTRYAAEAKPYGCDLLLALAMLALTIEWLRRPDQTRWLWYLAALVGPAVGYSFPAIFMAGGVSLVIAWVMMTGRRNMPAALADGTGTVPATLADGTGTVPATLCWLPWIVYNVLLVAELCRSAGRQQVLGRHDEPADDGRDALGQHLPADHATAEVAAVAAGNPRRCDVGLSRRRAELGQHLLAALRRSPAWPRWCDAGNGCSWACCWRRWDLNFIAAALHRFPYGGHSRMTLFLAPAFCTLIAVGLTAVLGVDRGSARRAKARPTQGGLQPAGKLQRLHDCPQSAGPAGCGFLAPRRDAALQIDHDAACPRVRPMVLVRDGPSTSELVSCETDLKTDLSPDKLNCGWSSLYFCNQRIYSPRHARGEKPQLDRVSVDRPLRCVLYRSPKEEQESPPPDPQVRQRWLEKMQADYDLVAHDTYPFATYDKWDRRRSATITSRFSSSCPRAATARRRSGKTPRSCDEQARHPQYSYRNMADRNMETKEEDGNHEIRETHEMESRDLEH